MHIEKKYRVNSKLREIQRHILKAFHFVYRCMEEKSYHDNQSLVKYHENSKKKKTKKFVQRRKENKNRGKNKSKTTENI
jgi:hypothetical protein